MVSRNANYTTRYLTLDSNILKKFAITERVAFELRGEVLQHHQDQIFDTPASAANRNITTATGTNFANVLIQNGGSRTMRVGGKIIF